MNFSDFINGDYTQRIIDAHYSAAYEVLGGHLSIDSDDEFRKRLDSHIPASRAGFLNPITFYNNFKQIVKKDIKIQAVILVVICSTIEKLMENLSLKTNSRATIKKFFEEYAGEGDKEKLLAGFEFVKQDTTILNPENINEVVDILYGIRNAFVHHAQLPQSDFRANQNDTPMLGALWIEKNSKTLKKYDGCFLRIKVTISDFENIFERTVLRLYRLVGDEIRNMEGVV